MSPVLAVCLAVAVIAVAVAVVLAVALRRTQSSLDELHSSVQLLREAPQRQPSTEVAVLPTPYAPVAVVVPSSEQVYQATMSRPLLRLASMSYGVRRALRPESRDRVSALMRREFRRRRKIRQRAGRRAARMASVERQS